MELGRTSKSNRIFFDFANGHYHTFAKEDFSHEEITDSCFFENNNLYSLIFAKRNDIIYLLSEDKVNFENMSEHTEKFVESFNKKYAGKDIRIIGGPCGAGAEARVIGWEITPDGPVLKVEKEGFGEFFVSSDQHVTFI